VGRGPQQLIARLMGFCPCLWTLWRGVRGCAAELRHHREWDHRREGALVERWRL